MVPVVEIQIHRPNHVLLLDVKTVPLDNLELLVRQKLLAVGEEFEARLFGLIHLRPVVAGHGGLRLIPKQGRYERPALVQSDLQVIHRNGVQIVEKVPDFQARQPRHHQRFR